jgi:hypothetical protein
MQSTSKAFLGLVALALAAATPALAQDTTSAGRTPQPGQPDTLTMPGQGGGADTSGYSGMERNDPAGAKKADTTGQAVETGAVKPSETETQPAPAPANTGGAGESKDPNGFKWTEPDAWAKAGQTPPPGATEAVQKPNSEPSQPGQGGTADTSGFSGMERDTSATKDKSKSPSDSTQN